MMKNWKSLGKFKENLHCVPVLTTCSHRMSPNGENAQFCTHSQMSRFMKLCKLRQNISFAFVHCNIIYFLFNSFQHHPGCFLNKYNCEGENFTIFMSHFHINNISDGQIKLQEFKIRKNETRLNVVAVSWRLFGEEWSIQIWIICQRSVSVCK